MLCRLLAPFVKCADSSTSFCGVSSFGSCRDFGTVFWREYLCPAITAVRRVQHLPTEDTIPVNVGTLPLLPLIERDFL